MACYDVSPYTCTYDSNAGASKDYTALDTWEGDSDNDLSGTGITTLECYGGPHNDSITQLTGAANADATHYRQIIGNGGNKITFNYTTDSTLSAVFDLREDYARIIDLIVKITNNIDQGDFGGMFITGEPVYAHRCWFECKNAGAGSHAGTAQGAGTYCCSCVANENDDHGFILGSVAYCYHCTAGYNGDDGYDEGAGANVVYNCASTGHAADDFDVGFSGDYNASEDNSAPDGGNSVTSVTEANAYTDAAGNDYHVKDASSPLYQVGSAANEGPFGTDYDGVAWDAVNPSIGAFEYVSAEPPVGGISIQVAMMYYKQKRSK